MNKFQRIRIEDEIRNALNRVLYGDVAIDFAEWIIARKHIWSGAHNARHKKEATK